MEQVSVINTIVVPAGMEAEAERVRSVYVDYFSRQTGFVSSTFYKALNRDDDGALRYVNIVVWASQAHFEQVVNQGFDNAEGENLDGLRVLGKGFPAPIQVWPGQYQVIAENS
ncbi:antibiotic biosynthesis monooxygenase family protein [Bowmanella dokdonensis]|uniref:Antibiotic biosynthesis monooxygenase n=1 Tax=Bowmanella dokdonensis TaxID=751969 RepID=A0A939ISZ0_9ALTE|nr:antibiotic biosynthesis monooxygenase [Bowmanella dokdonensis]MBN7827669.1 antibiotic biosynthesis monooxygenase [Bowmanella dokdonensis]